MKRIYSTPQTECMPMQLASVLCISGEIVPVDNNAYNDITID